PGAQSPPAEWTGCASSADGDRHRPADPTRRSPDLPGTDSWTATSTTSAPAGRYLHTAVWTGSEMIVWGGYNGSDLNTGGRYNPGTDSWVATSTFNAPAARDSHAAVWTGSQMVVWGGFNSGSYYNSGRSKYRNTNHPATTSTANPTARRS